MDNDTRSFADLLWLRVYGPPIPIGTTVMVGDGTLAVIESIREHPGPLGPVYVLVSDAWPPQLPLFSCRRGYYEGEFSVVSVLCESKIDGTTVLEEKEGRDDAPCAS